MSSRNTHEKILDAARTCLERFGVRRTTLSDIAREAGLSRPTVYRHWPDIDSLLADLLTREMRRVFAAADPGTPADGPGTGTPEAGTPGAGRRNGREVLLAEAASVIGTLREHPLFTRILATEPEVLATYTFQRLGASQLSALELLEQRIADGQGDGSIRPGDPAALARMVLLVAQGAVTSWRLADDVLPGEKLTAEVIRLLDAYLRPEGAPR